MLSKRTFLGTTGLAAAGLMSVPSSILKAAIDLGNGEILSLGRNSKKLRDGKFKARIVRSLDNWETVTQADAIFDIPRASYTVTGTHGYSHSHNLYQG